jgi:NAD(P)-dependent dehydrogenase (short-subunit alcohol dehydrogenase family)
LITGVSSGFGRLIAEKALARGDQVSGTLRQEGQCAAFNALAPGQAAAYRVDVTDRAAVERVVGEIVHDHGPPDIVVNNAGTAIIGAVEELSVEQIRQVFETNFFGMIHVLKAVLPHMRSRRQGHVINMSSMTAIAAVGGYGSYSASKFAVEGLTESLRLELAPLGIQVTMIEPGRFETPFVKSVADSAQVIPDYQASSGSIRVAIRDPDAVRASPAAVADAVLAVADDPRPPLRVPVGSDAVRAAREKVAAWKEELDSAMRLSDIPSVANAQD